ncbi:NAD(P)/FAD-dependent oxidoreductase [Micromonospora chalcea]|uniref:NAD(P)/FAD-dependent oxidoreductase n=1 Tax=Micromonospora TaxID=1873 RepID=UPI00064BB9A4|nr:MULTISPECIES: hypothetical protein [unclassified Micromonospora]MDG4752825.1 hypothetical protein [Micromonospora sp. WMMD718]
MAAAGWAAVGDAASSVDPLSSDGVARAITSGVAAATAVMRWLDGDAMALEGHRRSGGEIPWRRSADGLEVPCPGGEEAALISADPTLGEVLPNETTTVGY